MKSNLEIVDGVVEKALPGYAFIVKLDNSEHRIRGASTRGYRIKARSNDMRDNPHSAEHRVNIGDRVHVEFCPDNLQGGASIISDEELQRRKEQK